MLSVDLSIKKVFNRRSISLYRCVAVSFIAFMLVFCNGRPFILSNGLYCLFASIGLFFMVLMDHEENLTIPKEQRVTLFLLLGLIFSATISLIMNVSAEVLWNTYWGFYVPLFMFFFLASLRLNVLDISSIFVCLAIGVIMRFGYGAWVFYQEWGNLSFNELLSARFDVGRMESYGQATFGNTANTASLLVILFPALVVALTQLKLRAWCKIIIGFGISIILLNVCITGSRAALAMVILIWPFVLFMFKSKWFRTSLFVILILLGLFFTFGSEKLVKRQLFIDSDQSSQTNFLDSYKYFQIDSSVSERTQSIFYGIQVLKKKPFGIGSGMSYVDNPYTIAHQFLISQGDELGWLAILFIILLFMTICKKTFSWKSNRNNNVVLSQVMVFSLVPFTWMIYALLANMTISSGPTISWVGLLIFFLALSNNNIIYNGSGNLIR